MLGRYKKPIIIITVIIFGLLVYFYYKGSDPVENTLLQVSGPERSEVLSQEIRRSISQINSIKLDTTIFNNPILRNLVDHSEALSSEPSGRQNPFAPLGVGSTPNNSGDAGTGDTEN